MVPVLSVSDGQWLLADQLEVMMKPGGHGAIWKLMLDEGVFGWLSQLGCQVRGAVGSRGLPTTFWRSSVHSCKPGIGGLLASPLSRSVWAFCKDSRMS